MTLGQTNADNKSNCKWVHIKQNSTQGILNF